LPEESERFGDVVTVEADVLPGCLGTMPYPTLNIQRLAENVSSVVGLRRLDDYNLLEIEDVLVAEQVHRNRTVDLGSRTAVAAPSRSSSARYPLRETVLPHGASAGARLYRSFAEIVTHVADISYVLCSNVKGEATPATASAKGSKTGIIAYLKGAFGYCDGVYSGFTDAHLNDPADFFGVKTNKMFILTQVGNHNALHYGNLVTYLRLNGLVPSGGWF
jgi:hypothetical protein